MADVPYSESKIREAKELLDDTLSLITKFVRSDEFEAVLHKTSGGRAVSVHPIKTAVNNIEKSLDLIKSALRHIS